MTNFDKVPKTALVQFFGWPFGNTAFKKVVFKFKTNL